MTQPRPGGPRRRPAATPRGRGAPSRPRTPRRSPRPRPVGLRLADSGRRTRAALLVFAFILSLFAGRLVQLQGIDAAAYAADATQLTTVALQATRGTIRDDKGYPLATSVQAVNITTDQTLVTNPSAEAAQLAPLVGVDAATLTRRLSGTARFAYVAKLVTPATWKKVEALNLAGIFAEKTSKRVYPAGPLAANVIGFVGADGSGLGGLEYQLQNELAGRNGSATFDSAGGLAIPGAGGSTTPPLPGADVWLTIDRDVQWEAQQAITAAVHSSRALSGTVVVMSPGTGQILALATAPTFDPNNPGAAPAADRGNRALTEAYEPGSTGKVITASALLSNNLITPQTRLTVPNRISRGGQSFKDYFNHGDLKLTYAGTIALSSNIGTIEAADRLGGMTRLYPYLRAFGLGRPLGLDFPGANPGIVPPPSQWSATTGYTMTFGQGYSVNAVQMASVYATIANGGVRVSPSLVKQTVTPDGVVHPAATPARTRVISPSVAAEITEMLEGVVGPGGTGPEARIAGYRVAGKTGTANRYDASCGCYRGYTMSFIGFAPADNPQVVVAVTLQNPDGGGGGSLAGPVFRQVMQFTLQTEQVPPTGAAAPRVQIFWK